MSRTRRFLLFGGAAAASLGPAAPAWAVLFAQYNSYAQGSLPAPYLQAYDAAAAIGTPPSGTTGAAEGYPGVVSPFYPAFDTDQIVLIGVGGQLTLQFPQPLAPAGGPQIGVFSNVGLIDAQYPGAVAGNPAAVFGGGSAEVSVSQDGSAWVNLGESTFDIPENYYLNAGPYDLAPPSQPQTADFGQAFTGTLSSFDGESYSQVVTTLNGSAGGTWLNLYGSGLSQINYIRFTELQTLPAGSYLAIQAVSVADAVSASASWLPVGGGSWAGGGNWQSGVIPQQPEDVALFNSPLPATVTLDGNWTVGNLVFSNANSYCLAPGTGGTLTLDNGALPATVQYTNNLTLSAAMICTGAVTISGNGTLTLGGTSTFGGVVTVKSGSLNLTPGARIDIASFGLVIDFNSPASDPVATIAAALKSGAAFRASGNNYSSWNGPGIDSSTIAAAASSNKYALGYLDGDNAGDNRYGTVSANQILVEYTLNGNAFLEPSVGNHDLQIVAANYGVGSGMDWADGSFDYSGSVGNIDLQAVAANYGNVSPDSEGALDGGGELELAWQSAQADGLPLTIALPEPVGAGLLVCASLLPSRRRARAASRTKEKKMKTKLGLFLMFLSGLLGGAKISRAELIDAVTFANGNSLNVQGDYGSGADTAYLVIDLNNANQYYAWQFNWNPGTTVNGWQMLQDIAGQSVLSTSGVPGTSTVTNAAGDPNLTITATYYASFAEHYVTQMQYGTTLGANNDWSFFTGAYSAANVSAADPQGMTWSTFGSGIDELTVSNGQFVGWVDVYPHTPNPTLPAAAAVKPGRAVLLGMAAAWMLARRAKRASRA